jgi:predicted nucleotidyltransferase
MGTAPAIGRGAIVRALHDALAASPLVRAAWEGGSAAFGALDAYSDVDVIAVVADDAVEPVFALAQAALAALSPIAQRFDVPATAGYAQKFYRLRDAAEWHMVDLVLLRRSDPLLFREVELHGHGLTWFDRDRLLDEPHLDAAADRREALDRVPVLAAGFEMLQHLAAKELAREHFIDAIAFYQAWVLRPLVEALRLLHCPARRNFGLRYLWRDLPAAAAQRVQRLAYVGSPEALQSAHAEAVAWCRECLQRLRETGPGSGSP